MLEQKINLKYILIIIFLSFIVGVAVLFYWWQIKIATDNMPQIVSPQKTAETPKPLDTSDWKTYQDKKYVFEFRYPADFYIKQQEIKDEDIFYIYEARLNCADPCDKLNMRISFGAAQNENLLPVTQWVSQNVEISAPQGNDEPLSIDGTAGLKRVYKHAKNRTVAIFVFFPHKDNKLKIIYHFEAVGFDNIQFLEEIISSFRFLK